MFVGFFIRASHRGIDFGIVIEISRTFLVHHKRVNDLKSTTSILYQRNENTWKTPSDNSTLGILRESTSVFSHSRSHSTLTWVSYSGGNCKYVLLYYFKRIDNKNFITENNRIGASFQDLRGHKFCSNFICLY